MFVPNGVASRYPRCPFLVLKYRYRTKAFQSYDADQTPLATGLSATPRSPVCRPSVYLGAVLFVTAPG